MRRLLVLLSLSLLLAPLASRPAAAQADAMGSEWQRRAAIPYHVYGHASATIQGKIHILGGCHTEDWQKPSTKHQVYNPAADAWAAAADLPLDLGWAMPAVLDGNLYLFGGGFHKPGVGQCATDEAWVYDREADSWSRLPTMPDKRMNGFAVAVGNAIYISLGYNRQGGRDNDVLQEYVSTYRYDPGDGRYARVADSPETGCYIAAGAHSGKVYAVIGSHHETSDMDAWGLADDALVYDPVSDCWSRIPAPRIEKRVYYLTQCSASVVRDARLYVIGGRTRAGRTRVTSYFDIEARRFVRGPDLPEGRCCGGGAIASSALIIAGGFLRGVGRPAEEVWRLSLDAACGPEHPTAMDFEAS